MNTVPQATLSARGLVVAGLVVFVLLAVAGGFHSLPHNLFHYGIPVGGVGLILFAILRRCRPNLPPA